MLKRHCTIKRPSPVPRYSASVLGQRFNEQRFYSSERDVPITVYDRCRFRRRGSTYRHRPSRFSSHIETAGIGTADLAPARACCVAPVFHDEVRHENGVKGHERAQDSGNVSC